MKLEVGQFARLKSGYICKIININDFREPNMKYGIEANYLRDIMFIGDNDIAKASYNIVDILEVGDILVDDTNRKLEILLIDNELMVRNAGLIYDNNYYLPIKSIAIKSAITHEQMEQMAYKVED